MAGTIDVKKIHAFYDQQQVSQLAITDNRQIH